MVVTGSDVSDSEPAGVCAQRDGANEHKISVVAKSLNFISKPACIEAMHGEYKAAAALQQSTVVHRPLERNTALAADLKWRY
jgi:hypothetical protein